MINLSNQNDQTISMNNMDEQTMKSMTVEMDPKAIPDLQDKLINIYKLLEDIETPEMVELEKTDRKKFEVLLTHKYYESIDSIKLINLMLDPQRYTNLEFLLDMFEKLDGVKKGNADIQVEYKSVCDKLNEKYVYPKHGGKENFEKVMLETQNKK